MVWQEIQRLLIYLKILKFIILLEASTMTLVLKLSVRDMATRREQQDPSPGSCIHFAHC